MRRPDGSLWFRWDLHVHTPDSIVHNYPGGSEAAWEAFIADLEGLPAEFKVVGINDYLFVDGYERVLAYRAAGRLANLDLILPVVELRIDKFAGTGGALQRVNWHVIFSDEVSPQTIRDQFLSRLVGRYQLGSAASDLWEASPTREALEDLGRKIIANVPSDRREQYGAPITEGFNNFNVSLDRVQEALKSHFFQGKCLTAVGKTEWDQIRWNEGSIAEKKSVVAGADFLFVAAESPALHERARSSLISQGVNSRLLDCSDAHWLSTASHKDRIGNTWTWVNADTTFEGLRHARLAFDSRVFIGDRPPQLRGVERYPSRYLKSVQLRKKPLATTTEEWFDGARLELNPGLVAIIGNKGSGKSALIDVLGLVGNGSRLGYASFLQAERFLRPPSTRGTDFEVEATWADGLPDVLDLGVSFREGARERATYLPQSFYDEICNELEGVERSRFDEELKKVIFSHIPSTSHRGARALDEYLRTQEEPLVAEGRRLRERLTVVNAEVVRLGAALNAERVQRLRGELAAREAEAERLTQQEPEIPEAAAPAIPGEDGEEGSAETPLARARIDHAAALQERDLAMQGLAQLEVQLSACERLSIRVGTLRQQVGQWIQDAQADFELIGLDATALVRLGVDEEAIHLRREELAVQAQPLRARLNATDASSLNSRVTRAEEEIERLELELSAPERARAEAVEAHRIWEVALERIRGGRTEPGTIEGLRAALEEVAAGPGRMSDLNEELKGLIRSLFATLEARVSIYRDAFGAVQSFIDTHDLARDRFQLRFEAIVADAGFEQAFTALINRARGGRFSAREDGDSRIRSHLHQHRVETADGTLGFVRAILDDLFLDPTTGGVTWEFKSQLRQGITQERVLDFVTGLEYLEPRYLLRMADRDVKDLSPGERGALLLVFYLLVDPGEGPLLIDQPEENLDNQTIVNLLVPALDEAKKRRQVVIVTHNPNLAVVCDAQQVIVAKREPGANHGISYSSGALENPIIKRQVIDLLEGTRPAFDDRSAKYFQGGI